MIIWNVGLEEVYWRGYLKKYNKDLENCLDRDTLFQLYRQDVCLTPNYLSPNPHNIVNPLEASLDKRLGN